VVIAESLVLCLNRQGEVKKISPWTEEKRDVGLLSMDWR
jgi:hypothetical protein